MLCRLWWWWWWRWTIHFFLDATEVDAKHFKPTVSKHDSSPNFVSQIPIFGRLWREAYQHFLHQIPSGNCRLQASRRKVLGGKGGGILELLEILVVFRVLTYVFGSIMWNMVVGCCRTLKANGFAYFSGSTRWCGEIWALFLFNSAAKCIEVFGCLDTLKAVG